MTFSIDQPKAVRPGEALEPTRLEPYLREHLNLTGELKVRQFPSGFSNLTYLLELGDTPLVLRRPPFGANIKSAHDMGREYRVLSHLHPVYDKAPKPLLYCEDASVIGAPFYVMERVEGVILRGTMPKENTPAPEVMRGVATALIDALAELHAVDLGAAGLRDFGRPEGYVARQIRGWTERYKAAQTDDVPTIDAAAGWLEQTMPPESGASLVHNDFKYDNVVLAPHDPTRITAVLDWEMATVGDPLMDVGTSLGYWTQADDPPAMRRLRLSPTALPGNPTRAEVLEQYERSSGRNVPNPVFYYVYGLFKIAVILQQIYARYKKGLTKDERFAGLIQAVRACGEMAERAVDRGSV